jgi:hypothetical protein
LHEGPAGLVLSAAQEAMVVGIGASDDDRPRDCRRGKTESIPRTLTADDLFNFILFPKVIVELRNWQKHETCQKIFRYEIHKVSKETPVPFAVSVRNLD